MATDQSTVILEDLPLPEHEDYEVTGDESFVTAQQSLSQVHETPTKSDAGDSKHRDLAERSESQQSINEDSTEEFPSRTDQTTIDRVPEETDMQATAEDSLGETLTEEGDDFSKEEEKELDKTTDDANNASAKAKAPRIGFKHDPAEEAIMRKVELDVGVKKKKKKRNNRSKSQRGLGAPSGFEPFYADTPLTPQEFESNKTIYDPALPILDRIDEGIKRFLAKRRLEPHRRKVFLKYLQYGGVSVGQNQMQGVTPQELKEMDKEEAMQARSNTAIFPNEGRDLPISFNDVVKGYLTGYFMGHYNPEAEEDIKICTGTIKNFFTYLLYHDVCPEQTEDLEKARRTCDKCEKELWMTQQLVHNDGPGHFNRGCSMLFGGYYFEHVDDIDAWQKIRWANPDVFTREIARKVIKYAIAIAGDDRMTRKFKVLVEWNHVEAKQIPDIDGFEVISVEHPSELTKAYYRELAPDLVPIGKVKAKEFRDPARGPFDLKPWEKVDWEAGYAPTYEFNFFVEEPLLALILPGMKFITSVFETNFGMHFFDEVLDVLPTNYLFLYNDWMMEYKAPKPVEWIGDEKEIERRRADEFFVRPPKFSERDWALHVITREVKRAQRGESGFETHAKRILKALDTLGIELEKFKRKEGPRRAVEEMRRGAGRLKEKEMPKEKEMEQHQPEEFVKVEPGEEDIAKQDTVEDEPDGEEGLKEPAEETAKIQAAAVNEKVIKQEPSQEPPFQEDAV